MSAQQCPLARYFGGIGRLVAACHVDSKTHRLWQKAVKCDNMKLFLSEIVQLFVYPPGISVFTKLLN